MKTIFKLIFISVTIVLLAGCSSQDYALNETGIMLNIEKPRSNNISIQGTWELVDIETQDDTDAGNVSYQLGDYYLIDNTFVGFKEKYTFNPEFSAKYINYNDYLEYIKASNLKNVSYEKNNIQIITIKDGQNFLQVFMIFDENNIATRYGTSTLYFRKTEDHVSEDHLKPYQQFRNISGNEQANISSSQYNASMLLGVKSVIQNEEGLIDYAYFTYLIHMRSDEVIRIYKMKNLFVPRDTGFWIAGVERSKSNNIYYDNVYAYPINLKDTQQMEFSSALPTLRHISYIDSQFISLENDKHLSGAYNQYEIQKIDNIKSNQALDVADISKDDSLNIFNETIFREVNAINGNENESSFRYNTKNIGITRYRGSWIFRSSIETLVEGDIIFKNFGVDIVPSDNTFNFGKLSIPWANIKILQPSAIDATTSPNSHICMIQAQNEFIFYKIFRDRIIGGPICTIPIAENDKVVMIQWGLDNYAESWEKEFKNQELTPVEYTRY